MGSDVSVSDQSEVEALCDCFASELLMPAVEWTDITMKLGSSVPVLRRLTSAYNVSGHAAARRLVEAGSWRCAVIIWELSEDVGDGPRLTPIRFYRKSFLTNEGWPVPIGLASAFPATVRSGGRAGPDFFGNGRLTFGNDERDIFFESGWTRPGRILATVILGEPSPETLVATFFSEKQLKRMTPEDVILGRISDRHQYNLEIDS